MAGWLPQLLQQVCTVQSVLAVLSAVEIAVSVYEMIGLYTWTTIENIAIWRVFSPRLGVRLNTSMAQMIAEAR